MKTLGFLCMILAVFSACGQAVNIGLQGDPSYTNPNQDDQNISGPPPPPEREWTFLIYMAADNDLESAAIADLKELEAVRYNNEPVSILVLLDRHPAYDMTNGNWSDTRLFEVKSDTGGQTSTIISTRLDCLELGLSKDAETELNMADPLVLSRFIDFAKRAYPAKHYALFIWGHGTGWRGGLETGSLPMPLKAVAFDDTQEQYMSLPSFGRAIAGKGLSLLGFDTCYAAILEVAYEVRNDAALLVGSQGEIMFTGWDYTALFSDFMKRPVLSIANLGSAIQNQFSAQYAGLNNATISQIQLSQVNNLFLKFEDFTRKVAEAITGEAGRKAVMSQILHSVESYFFTSFPSDLYIDIFDFSKKITAIRSEITPNESLQNAIATTAAELENAMAAAVPSSWAKNGTTKKMGVHVIPLQGIAVPAVRHEMPYIKGSMSMDKSAFVENSRYWVPNWVPKSDSFLDKLFYWTF